MLKAKIRLNTFSLQNIYYEEIKHSKGTYVLSLHLNRRSKSLCIIYLFITNSRHIKTRVIDQLPHYFIFYHHILTHLC